MPGDFAGWLAAGSEFGVEEQPANARANASMATSGIELFDFDMLHLQFIPASQSRTGAAKDILP
jgi:hypothetical protein